jgi:hypothetical protein
MALLFYALFSIAGATPARGTNWTIGSPNKVENGQTLQRLKSLLLPLHRRIYENRRTYRTGAE